MTRTEDPGETVDRYRQGPALLARTLAGLAEADLDLPVSAGGWTVRETVHHIVDGDDLWKAGLKAALGKDQGEFTLSWYWALPQEDWARGWAYARRSLEPSLDLLAASRNHVLQLLAAVPDGWARAVAVRTPTGEVERLSVGDIVKMQADHLEHHVQRIAVARSSSHGPEKGE